MFLPPFSLTKDLAKCKVDSRRTSKGMLAFFEWRNTVIHEPGGTAPHDDITIFQPETAHSVRAAFPSPEKYGGQAKRNGDDRSPGILLVAVLMKAEFGSCDIAIDQARIGIIVVEPRCGRGTYSKVEEW